MPRSHVESGISKACGKQTDRLRPIAQAIGGGGRKMENSGTSWLQSLARMRPCLKTANRTERGRNGRHTAVSGWCYTTSLFSACSQWPKAETSTSTCRVIFPSSEEFAEHQQSVMLNKTGQLFILISLVSQYKANDLDSSAKDLDDTGWFLFSNCTFRQLRPQLCSGFRLEKTLVIEISEISGWSTLSCDS